MNQFFVTNPIFRYFKLDKGSLVNQSEYNKISIELRSMQINLIFKGGFRLAKACAGYLEMGRVALHKNPPNSQGFCAGFRLAQKVGSIPSSNIA